MTKLNTQTMKNQYDHQYDTFCRKNHDYGNSFEESLDQFGIVASIVRMSDKMKRLESLTDESKTQQVGSESLLDTLEDLSNYAAMTACWLKGVREEDDEHSENTIYAVNKPVITFTEDNENFDPRNYVLNMLSNIFIVVQMKLDKDEMLVPLDISDEAGLIAKCIVESNTKQEGVAVINNYICTRKDIPYELKDWIYGVIMHYLYYLENERTHVIDDYKYASSDLCNEDEKKIAELLQRSFHISCHRHEFTMTHEMYEQWDDIIKSIADILINENVSQERFEELVFEHNKLDTTPIIYQVKQLNTHNEIVDDNQKDSSVNELKVPERVDAINEIIEMLKKVLEFNYKIEWNRMTEDECVECKNIINRLHSMVTDGFISEETMKQLINAHVKFNPEATIHMVFNCEETKERPTEEQEAKRVALFNAEFLNMTKSMLNDIFDNILVCRNQNIPLAKRLTYTEYRQDKYDKIASLVLAGHIDFGEVSRIVNDYPNLRVAEKNHLLESIVAAAYAISEEPENEKPEFLNKKFHIPDDVLKDLTMPEEEPERKRTVLGMIFPFWL